LANATRETVHLAVLDQAEVIYLQKHESVYPAALYSRVGRKAPAYCTGVGKLLLAHLPETESTAVLQQAELRALTSNTITDRAVLEQELAQIRRQGYSVDNMEHEEGVYCIACPIRDHTGEVIAAVSITTTSLRLQLEKLMVHLPTLTATVDEISGELGYVGPA
jgi:DNA-binding IclR family transcriptional regulator